MKNLKIYENNMKRKVGVIVLTIALGTVSIGLTGCADTKDKTQTITSTVETSLNPEETSIDEAISSETIEALDKVNRYISYSEKLYSFLPKKMKPTTGDAYRRPAYYSDTDEESLNKEFKVVATYDEEKINEVITKIEQFNNKYKEKELSEETYTKVIEESDIKEALYAANLYLSTQGYETEKQGVIEITNGIIADETGLTIQEIQNFGENFEVSDIDGMDKARKIYDTLEAAQNPGAHNKNYLNNKMGYNITRNKVLQDGYNDISKLLNDHIKKINKR